MFAEPSESANLRGYIAILSSHPSPTYVGQPLFSATMALNADTKASLEVTKGATALNPIALDVSETESIRDEDELLLGPFPTDEEWATLPRVAGRIPWTAWTVAIVEFVERFSYYGTSAVFVNFIQKKLPPGSKTGAGFLKKPGSGALGMGQRASTGLTTCESTSALDLGIAANAWLVNQFWSYFTPLFGAWIADEYWGRYKTIQVRSSIDRSGTAANAGHSGPTISPSSATSS